MTEHRTSLDAAVAVVGIAVRVPGAEDAAAFWRNLCAGTESIQRFTADELIAAGIPRAELERPGYVPANGVMPGAECFDAAAFGIAPRDAELTDPQHRVFLECAWAALEDAGYDPTAIAVPVGVYAGCGFSQYLIKNLYTNPSLWEAVGFAELINRNVSDALPSLVSYRLDLRGPSIAVQTACSTSLTAVHLATQALLAGECDLALAGGVTLNLPQIGGYLAVEGVPLSSDGHCRAFDASAAGTVAGSGAAIVVLRRAAEAHADGDAIRALIVGSAVNNDGSAKLGYSAPSIEAQAAVIAQALEVAGVSPDTIGYVEAHGTGTALGDPVEVAALTQAFRRGTPRRGFCALGSVKSNVGHLDTAAGAAGLIKAVLAIEHGVIPQTLHVAAPSPRLQLDDSPFFVAAQATTWPAGLRRAGVSSLGLGGTNVHVVIEEAPPRVPAPAVRGRELVVVSARTRAALERSVARLAGPLAEPGGPALADVAHTLRTGRHAFRHRAACVASDVTELARALAPGGGLHRSTAAEARAVDGDAPVVFTFPGMGTSALALGPALRALVARCDAFRTELEALADTLQRAAGVDLASWLAPGAPGDAERARLDGDLAVAMPVMVAIEYALARQWIAWGVTPSAVIGHSAGEYAAAAVAGVMSPADAIELVALRARLQLRSAPGAMLAVELGAAALAEVLPAEADVAVENAPALSVAAGTVDAIARLEATLDARGVRHRRLPIDRAGHSRLLDPVLGAFEAAVRRCTLREPAIPLVANVTGAWARGGELSDPMYWVRQLRQAVRFERGAAALLADPRRVFLEVGVGHGMTRLVLQQRPPSEARGVRAVASVPPPTEAVGDGAPERAADLLDAAAQLWVAGAAIDLAAVAGPPRGRRVPLPTYPFARTRHWIDPTPWVPAAPTPLTRPAPAEEGIPEGGDQGGDEGGGEGDDEGDLEGFQPPSGPIERAIAAVWAEVLGIARISADDNFFLLGGSSLMLAAVTARLCERLAISVPLRVAIEAPTPRDLASRLEPLLAAAAPVAASTIPRLPSDAEPAPLSWAQEHIWTFHAAGIATSAQNHCWAIDVAGPLDLDALDRALDDLATRHESLRTVAVALGDHVGQIVRPELRLALEVSELPGGDLRAVAAEARRLARADRHHAFDLFAGPLFRLRAIRISPERHVLVFTGHVLILDGWSSDILTRELGALYGARVRGGPAALPELPVRYRDFAHWERRGAGASRLDAMVGELARRLGGQPPVLRLPPRQPRPAERSFRGAQHAFTVPAALVTRATELARRLGEPLTSVARAAFTVVLHRWSGAERFLLATGSSNRGDAELAGVVGFFAHPLVFRAELAGGPSFEEVVRRGRAATLEALDFQACPPRRLFEAWPTTGRLENPLHCATFLLHRRDAASAMAFDRLPATAFDVRSRADDPDHAADYAWPSREDVWFVLDEEPDGSLTGALQHDLDVIDRATARWLGDAYGAVLAAAVDRPQASIASLAFPAPPGGCR
jgi:acyl transferase domain-containing protein